MAVALLWLPQGTVVSHSHSSPRGGERCPERWGTASQKAAVRWLLGLSAAGVHQRQFWRRNLSLLLCLFILGKVICVPSVPKRALPREVYCCYFLLSDYSNLLIPQTDRRTINKYKKKKNSSSITKSCVLKLWVPGLSHLPPSKAGALQRKESKRYENYKDSENNVWLGGFNLLRRAGLCSAAHRGTQLSPLCCGLWEQGGVGAKCHGPAEGRRFSSPLELTFWNRAAQKWWCLSLLVAEKWNGIHTEPFGIVSELSPAWGSDAAHEFDLLISVFFLFLFSLYFQTPSTKKTPTTDTETVQFGAIISPPIDLMKDF